MTLLVRKFWHSPDILLVFWTKACEEVVGVHDNMNEGVDQTKEGTVATGEVSTAEPEVDGHDSVVIDM